MKKFLFLLLTVVLLIMPLSVSAENEWYFSDDTLYSSLSGKYYEVELAYLTDGILPGTFDIYKSGSNNDPYYIHVPRYTKHFVTYGEYAYSNESIYATSEGKQIIEEFNNGNFSKYMIFGDQSELYSGVLNGDIVKQLDAIEPTKTLLVSALRNLEMYAVAGVDKTGTFYHIHGAFYKSGSGYYYINYDVLDNSYFDANDNFSYRKGQVKAVEVPSDIVARLNNEIVPNIRFKDFTYNETYDAYHKANESWGNMPLFIFSTAILGYAIPLVPFVLSLVFAQSNKAMHPKRWYVLTFVSAFWLLVSTLINLLILLC